MQALDRPFERRKSDELSPGNHQGLKVLCIDDDPQVLRALARNLEARGATAVCAYHGMQGYWLACTESPDVIVTDMMMPRGNGEYVVECLKRNTATRGIPVIVLSGVGLPSLEARIRKLDVESVFTKPARFASLYRMICALAS